jgi:hypothetical protein
LAASDPGVDHPQIPVFLARNRQDDAVRPENRVDRTVIKTLAPYQHILSAARREQEISKLFERDWPSLRVVLDVIPSVRHLRIPALLLFQTESRDWTELQDQDIGVPGELILREESCAWPLRPRAAAASQSPETWQC